MLIRINIKNFLSFSERYNGFSQEFSTLAGKVRNKSEHVYFNDDVKILKFSAIYGANASGKSNLIKTINFIRSTIIKKLPQGFSEQYCKIIPENKNKDSYFETEFLLNGFCYSYGFEVFLNQGKFVSEWLVKHNKNNIDEVIFERDIKNGKYTISNKIFSKELKRKLDDYASDIRNDDSVLFLTIMNQNKKSLYEDYDDALLIKDVFNWFKYKLNINYPNMPISDYSYMTNSKNIDKICNIISTFGTGIQNYKIIEIPINKAFEDLPESLSKKINADLEAMRTRKSNNSSTETKQCIIVRGDTYFCIFELNNDTPICKTIQFSHGNNIFFSLSEESDGTVRLLDLLEILIADNEDNSTYIIDELDRCLHPILTYKFIDTFLKLAHKRKLQLIVTTHESRLLDFDLLRRDEIWFVNKRSSGESDIYSLDEYNERFDKKIDKAYLEGRYGGVPIFNTVFPFEGE